MTKIFTIIAIILAISCSNSETTSPKQVCAKFDNNLLIACDKSRCEVSSQQFSMTQLGGMASCKWKSGGH